MQFLAAPERFLLSWAEARMDCPMDWAVLRPLEEIWRAVRIISMGFGVFGSWALERADSQRSGNWVALHAWRISGETVGWFGVGRLMGLGREVVAEEGK